MNQKHENRIANKVSASAKSGASLSGAAAVKGKWSVVCRGPDGEVKWEDRWENLVVNSGLDHALDVTLSGGTQVATWYIGLTDGTPTVAAGDTMASHAGWVEVIDYTEAARVTWVDGGVSGQSADNSASTATFSINATTTIGGAFLTSDSTKNGTTGILYAAGAFSAGDKTLNSGDTLDVTATFTSAAV